MPEPRRGNDGASIRGPRNPTREGQNPDLMAPPPTDKGTVPNLRFAFADAHMRLEEGGWARQVTTRELPIATAMAGVDMRLERGVAREMHWHKQAEWAYVLAGTARITVVDQDGRTFAADLAEGDLWYFPAGIPHGIQGVGPDGCEFLLVFDDGAFSEDSTFLLTDWLAHTPRDVLAKNFGVDAATFDPIPAAERYIFPASDPPALAEDTVAGEGPAPHPFAFSLPERPTVQTGSGRVWVVDSSTFTVSTTIAAALVEVEPGAMRELHWHPNGDEWQFYLAGSARMTVFASSATARTFDFEAGDVGYVPFPMGHYVENRGETTLRFLEVFRSDRYADVSLAQWLALTPHELVAAHLNLDRSVIDAIRTAKQPVVGEP